MTISTQTKTIIGMVHIQALPGTPQQKLSVTDIIKLAIDEAEIYFKAGVDAVMIENMHDIPYLKGEVGPEISSLMAIIAWEIKKRFKKPVGIQILAGANKAALSVAHSAQLDFIRAEGFVFGHLADEGYIESCAGELLRYRKNIGAQNVKIFTDIKKKHSSHTITSDVNILETAKAASFFLSDGIIITGQSTGSEADLEEIKLVKNNINLPVIIGSGVTKNNLSNYWYWADAFIVGSHFKQGGQWQNPINVLAVELFMNEVEKLRLLNA